MVLQSAPKIVGCPVTDNVCIIYFIICQTLDVHVHVANSFIQSDLRLAQDKTDQLSVKGLAQGSSHGSLVLGFQLTTF